MTGPQQLTIDERYREFLDQAVETLARESWLIGIIAVGSLASGTMDAFSDLDLVIVVNDEHLASVLDNRLSLAESLGPLLSAFTGEHVGQPGLLLCLYGPPLLHVDLYFETMADTIKRAGDGVILWDPDKRLPEALMSRNSPRPEPDAQWIEDRFWVWVHKACGKIGRGELFEAIEYLAFLRSRVLGPLGLLAAGKLPIGVKRIELDAPTIAVDLETTLAGHDARQCVAALHATVGLYRRLRAADGTAVTYRHAAEMAVMDYMASVEATMG